MWQLTTLLALALAEFFSVNVNPKVISKFQVSKQPSMFNLESRSGNHFSFSFLLSVLFVRDRGKCTGEGKDEERRRRDGGWNVEEIYMERYTE